jgi:hypothetical protein
MSNCMTPGISIVREEQWPRRDLYPVWLIMEMLLGATSMTASDKASTIGSARRIHRFACWIGAGILFVGLLPACASSDYYEFKPSGIGRGEDAAYSKPVGGLYDYEGTPTPTPGGS